MLLVCLKRPPPPAKLARSRRLTTVGIRADSSPILAPKELNHPGDPSPKSGSASSFDFGARGRRLTTMRGLLLVLAMAAVASCLIGVSLRGTRAVELEGRGRRSAHQSSLQADIARLDRQLGIKPTTAAAAADDAAAAGGGDARTHPAKGRRTASAAAAHASHRGAKRAAQAQGLSPKDALATATKLWGQPKLSGPWEAEDQEKYDRAVHHAQIAERHGVEVYHPLGEMSHSFTEDAGKDNEMFEDQLAHLFKMMEPTYLSEALGWAHSGDTDDNTMLRPVALALERPLVKQLDDEARTRVVNAVDALGEKHHLTLAEKEQLRAHLMAPLLMRIQARVHKQVSQYVVRVARAVVMKAANETEAGAQAKAGLFNGRSWVEYPTVPKLNDADLKFANALHDLHGVWKEGVVDREGYETQRAKLLSDWLKYTVNEAGGNSNYVLRIMFGGDVRGVTDTGIRHPSRISVHKKLALEKGIASLGKDRERRLTRDLIWNLVHGKGQWGDLDECDKNFSGEACEEKWGKIKSLVRAYSRSDDPDLEWGNPPPDAEMSEGTRALSRHFDHVAAAGGSKRGKLHPLTGLSTVATPNEGESAILLIVSFIFVAMVAVFGIWHCYQKVAQSMSQEDDMF